MRRNTPSSFRNTESGSTILEVLVALVVLSVLGIGAWHAVGVSLRLAGRLRDRMTSSAAVLQLDDKVRELAREIQPPFWAPDQIVENTDGNLSVPYLRGDPAGRLLLSYKEGTLVITAGQETNRYPGFRTATLSSAANEQNRQYGITLKLETADRESVIITARFGGTPLAVLPP